MPFPSSNIPFPNTSTPFFHPQNTGGQEQMDDMAPWTQFQQTQFQQYEFPFPPPSQGSQTQASGSSEPSTQMPNTQNPNILEWCTEEDFAQTKRKSGCWVHYQLSKDGKKCKCRTCGKIFSADTKGGTGHLTRHTKKCGGPSSDPTQPKISQFHPQGFIYNYERDRDELGRMIVHAEQPFLFAENDAFNNYINRALQPKHKKMSRKTVRSAAMKTYLEYKLKLVNELANLPCRVSLTADAWDGGYGLHYLCVTCHWLDNEWMLQKRIIHFKMLEYPHTGLNISHHLMEAIDAYSLRDKIMSMNFDNATSMTYSANLVKSQLNDVILDGDALHVRCICHVLNLCVKDGTQAIGPFYHKIRNAIMSINSSNMRYQEWKGFCRQQRIKTIKIAPDCPTRWNSTYEMLSRAIEYKVHLTLFYNMKFPQNALLEDDWVNCEKYMQFLQLLYGMTHCFSSVYNPCSHSFLSNACLLAQLFAEHRSQHVYRGYLPSMEDKWRKYYTDIPMIYIFASILDPRQKYDGTFLLIDIYYSNMNFEDDVETFKNKVTNEFFSLYRVYESKYGTVSRFAPSQTSKNVSKRAKGLFAQAANMMSKFSGTESSSSKRTQSDVSELQMYLSYDFMKGMDDEEKFGLDILDWWKSQTVKHPILSAMARDIFAIQVSSVASERAFSASGRVLDDRRTRLKPETLEMCVCFKDWLDAETRSQDRTYAQNDDDEGTSTSFSSQSTQLADELEPLGDEDEDEDEGEDEDDQ